MTSAKDPAADEGEVTIEEIVKRLPLKGRLKELHWVAVSRHEPLNVAAAAASDVNYGIQSTDDIVKAQSRKTKK